MRSQAAMRHQNPPYGVSAFDLAVSICKVESATGPALALKDGVDPIPPAVVMGELAGERLAAELHSPAHIRGSGLAWPPSATVCQRSGSARLPACIAWALCEHLNAECWRWLTPAGRATTFSPTEAIAEIVATAVRRAIAKSTTSSITLIVPNTLTAECQDAMLRALRLRRIEAFLLWRPIAAALAWIEKFGESVIQRDPTARGAVGCIWTAHFGLDAFEIATIELHVRDYNGSLVVLPARRLPVLKTLYGKGLVLAEQLASHSTSSYASADGAAWNLLWTTSWLRRLLSGIGNVPSENQAFSPRGTIHHGMAAPPADVEFRRMIRQLIDGKVPANQTKAILESLTLLRSSWAPLEGPFVQQRLACGLSETNFHQWLQNTRKAAHASPPVLGLVGTGVFSNFLCGDEDHSGGVIDSLLGYAREGNLLIEGESQDLNDLLAKGGAICAARLRAGIPPYLDTLPQLESLVLRRGEPIFEDLLGTEDRYVDGGKPWTHRPDKLGLSIQREEQKLTLSVWREGEEIVREVEVPFPIAVVADTPVDLEIRMVPGQGNARVEVIPTESTALGGKRAYLDWQRARVTGKTKQQLIDEEPRSNPPLEKRGASALGWQGGYWTAFGGAKSAVSSFLESSERLSAMGLASRLKDVRAALWRTDPTERAKSPPNHYSVVSSEGELAEGVLNPEVLNEFLENIDERLSQPKFSAATDEIFRTLGYCSASTPNLMSALAKVAATPYEIEGYHLPAIGNCLRDPIVIARFVRSSVIAIRNGKLPNRTQWLSALSRVLMYRVDAARELKSDDCREITDFCIQAMVEQIRNGSAAFVFRYSSLCIVYLLRRRKYDPHYLSEADQTTKNAVYVFNEAIRRYRSRELEVIGGIVDLPHLMGMMIDYVNRKGRGRLVGLDISE